MEIKGWVNRKLLETRYLKKDEMYDLLDNLIAKKQNADIKYERGWGKQKSNRSFISK